ncbi:MAG: hypothetical protein P4L71_00690 [Acetobacteraceae bacterium]|nr:hypothetical protein [Acetobacteraceae bacterium]
MTMIGAASASPPAFQAQAASATPRKTSQDKDGDEATESASAKTAEAGAATQHKLNVQA